jgi:hypothetical protein
MSEFADKVRSLGVTTSRSHVETIRRDGKIVGKDIHDEAGNTTHVRDQGQGVTIRPETVHVKVGIN